MYAQKSHTKFGLKIGLNLSHASTDLFPDKDQNTKLGYQLGVTIENRLSPSFFIQSGLEFTTKGIKTDTKEHDTSLNPMYLQIPLTFAYKIHIAPKTHFVLNAGAYFAYGIGGKIDDGKAKKQDVFSNTGLKRFDTGILGGIGLEIKQITLSVNYELGLADIAQAGRSSYKNRNALLSLGYKFK